MDHNQKAVEVPRNRWGTLAEALALAGSEEALRTAGRNGDIWGRITHHYRQAVPLSPVYWNGELDYERSRIRPCAHVLYDNRGEHVSVYGWVTIEVDLDSVRDHFGEAKLSTKKKGGAPSKVPPEALIEVGAWLAANGIPETLVEVENRLREAIAAYGAPEPAESTVRSWAGKIVDAHRRHFAD